VLVARTVHVFIQTTCTKASKRKQLPVCLKSINLYKQYFTSKFNSLQTAI